MEKYDVIIIGGGPAGLSAALVSSFFGLRTLILEANNAGGSLANVYPWKIVENYLGFNEMKAKDVANILIQHIRSKGIEFKEKEEVISMKKREDNLIEIESVKQSYLTKASILAIGSSVPRKLGVNGESLDGVFYSVIEPREWKDTKALVVGGGNSALEQALALEPYAKKVVIAHRRDRFRASEENVKNVEDSSIEVLFNTEVLEILGSKEVEKVKLVNNMTRKISFQSFDRILISIGTTSNVEFLKKIGVEITNNRVRVDDKLMTSIQGIFAAGDVVGRWNSIPQAVAEGAYAALQAFKYVREPYW